jgi:hypothetical protein
MKNLFLAIFSLVTAELHAQYYYNDIIGTKEINTKMKAYLATKVKSVTAAGYDHRGVKTTDFNEWQDVQENGSVLKITTRNGQNVTRLYFQFDEKTRLVNARDSSKDIQTNTIYAYDADDNLVKLKTTMTDALNEFNQVKEKQFQYAEGKPVKMLLIQNGSDSIEYKFTLDENKNVKDEMMYHRGGSKSDIYYSYEQQKVYYFYDEKNRLTDITKYNVRLDRLLPEFMFEYDDSNRVIQKITVLSNIRYDTKAPDYLIWRYGFNEKGLKTKEVLYSKAKELKGKIEYGYTFY